MFVPARISISDRTRTVWTVWVYTYTVRPYAYVPAHSLSCVTCLFRTFHCVGKQIFTHCVLSLNESELNKLLAHDVKHCDGMAMASFLKYFS